MDADDTLEVRRPLPKPESEYAQRRPLDTRLVSIEIATGAAVDVKAPAGVKFNPSFVSATEIGYIQKNEPEQGIYYTSGRKGPKGDIRSVAWSPDGKRIAFHRRQVAPPTNWLKTFSRNPNFELTLTGILPSYNSGGDKFVITGRPAPGTALGASLQIVDTGTDKATSDLSRAEAQRDGAELDAVR